MASFDLNDDSVVVIVGSGAGGGTLGNGLAQKGINVVIQEAGGRYEIQDFVNDEWASFTQLVAPVCGSTFHSTSSMVCDAVTAQTVP